MAGPTLVTDDTFDSEVLKSDTPVLVDFYADWCGPCRILAPVIEDLADEFDGRAKGAKLDVDANPKVSADYQVRSIPTTIIFDKGKPIAQGVGVLPKASLKNALEQALAEDIAA